MIKIITATIMASFIFCGASHADGKAALENKGLTTRSDAYSENVSWVSLDKAVKPCAGEEAVDLQGLIDSQGYTGIVTKETSKTPGADAVNGVSTSSNYSEGITNLSDLIVAGDDGSIIIKDPVNLAPDQTLIITQGSITLTGAIGSQTAIFGYGTASGLISPGSSIIIGEGANYHTGTVGVFSSIIGSVTTGGLIGGEIVSGSIIDPDGSAVTMESGVIYDSDKGDEAKVLGIKNRQNKQSKAMKRLVAGESIIDEE